MVSEHLDEAEQYIHTMWRSDYGERVEVLEAGFGAIARAAFVTAGVLYKRYAPWIKPKFRTDLTKPVIFLSV